MSTTLVTGATGFIGSHLTRLLVQRGQSVRCLVRSRSNVDSLRDLDVELVEGNLLDPGSLSKAIGGVDQVYHVAGLISALRRRDWMQINGAGTANVAQACAAQSDPPALLYVSSVAAAGPSPRGRLRTEQDEPKPISDYGRSKRAGEVAVERLANRVATTVVRPGIVFGERDRGTLPMFRSVYRLRVHAIAGLNPPLLSVIHVADLVDLLVRAAEKGQRLASPRRRDSLGTGYYFACVPEYPDYLQLGRMLHRVLGRRRTWYIHIPEPIPWLIGGASQAVGWIRGKPNSLNIDKIREALVPSWACSCQAAEQDLGFAPREPLIERLRATADWYRRHQWL